MTDERETLLLEMRMKVSYSDKVTMPILLYEQIKAYIKADSWKVKPEMVEKITAIIQEGELEDKPTTETAVAIIKALGMEVSKP